MENAEFFWEKADQCRAMANGLADSTATMRGLHALALERDARALAIEAGLATAREIEPGQAADGNGASPKQ